MNGGLTLEALGFKDWSFDKFFQFRGVPVALKPLRKIEDADRVPDVFQGDSKACVPCAVSWIAMYFRPGLIVNWQTLAARCGTDEEGTKPSVVLNTAYNEGLIPNYFNLRNRSADNIYKALCISPLVIGVENLPMVPEPHFMVLWDVTEDGKNWRCFTWDKENGQGYLELSLDYPIAYAANFLVSRNIVPKRHGFLEVLADKLEFFLKR